MNGFVGINLIILIILTNLTTDNSFKFKPYDRKWKTLPQILLDGFTTPSTALRDFHFMKIIIVIRNGKTMKYVSCDYEIINTL